jgi:TolB-like protein
MGSDENKAFEVLRKNKEIHIKLIDQFNGTLIKEMGDGLLMSFELASQAVRCAIEIQKEAQSQDIPLKIGIHEGEMVFQDYDVLGDGVNIASRIQDGAKQGIIFISGSVYQDIKNQADIKTRFIEAKYFKNVDEKIKVFSVSDSKYIENINSANKFRLWNKKFKVGLITIGIIVVLMLLFWQINRTGNYPLIGVEQQHENNSIAVLPFYNLSGDPDNEFLSENFTDEIINHLFKIKAFNKVVPFSSVLIYKESRKLLPEIGEELGVHYILQGTFKQDKQRIKVTAALINAASNNQIWMEEFDKDPEAIFSIHSDIAIKISQSIHIFLSESEKSRIQSVPTKNLEAYRYYQKALEFKKVFKSPVLYNQAMGDSIKLWLNTAISIDPEYAKAYGLLGFNHLIDGTMYGTKPITTAAWNAKPYIEKSLELDPYEQWGLLAMALLKELTEWKFIAAEELYLKAIDGLPNELLYLSLYGEFLFKMNRPKEALDFINILYKKGFTLNDQSWVYETHTRALLGLNKKQEAAAINQKYLETLGSDYYCGAGKYHLCTKQYDSALYYFQSAFESQHWLMYLQRNQVRYATALYKSGEIEESEKIIARQSEKCRKGSGRSQFNIACFYSEINQVDSAFLWLERAFKTRNSELTYLIAEESLETIRNDSRYWDLYEKTGHLVYDEYLKNKKRNE